MFFNNGLSSIILLEQNHDDGMLAEEVPEEIPGEASAAYQAPETLASTEVAQEQTPGDASEVPSEEELLSMSINATQDLFTKVYLIKRIDRLKDWLNYLLDQLDKKVDVDELYTLENYRTFIDILSNIDITMATPSLYHLVAQLELELIELLQKIRAKIEERNAQEEFLQDKG